MAPCAACHVPIGITTHESDADTPHPARIHVYEAIWRERRQAQRGPRIVVAAHTLQGIHERKVRRIGCVPLGMRESEERLLIVEQHIQGLRRTRLHL